MQKYLEEYEKQAPEDFILMFLGMKYIRNKVSL